MAKKQLNFKFFSSKGFTLIELLVVLGILGILAAALLAAINPVEQLRKGQDTSLKNVATEFVASTTSYYSTLNALPWFSVVNGGANCYSGGSTLTAVGLGNLAGCITTLVTNGELKSSFSQTTNLSKVTVTNPDPLSGNAGDVVACFAPQSKSQQLDPNTKYNSDGSIKAGCPATGGACYWCAR
jgi:prepilin-type N-terminal cleavage/methylation domain-containing protein